ncbi:MAG: DUF1592 domain-containing protein, partial [Planctomycetota bacterium]
LPPDAVSKDGFTNDQQSMVLSPLQIEAYFEIAEKMLELAIVDPTSKPQIQSFKMGLGRGINTSPCPDKLILGANNHLLNNQDFVVTEPKPKKSFDFDHAKMRTRWRFNEGYQGNATVRGWRDYDSIYHAVYACMRGNGGYPNGEAYELAENGLLLRPAIPSAELFQVESTYGPRANFKISLRERPAQGNFRVTVRAAAYEDALLLNKQDSPCENADVVIDKPEQVSTVQIPGDGVYQIDTVLEEVSSEENAKKKAKPSLTLRIAGRQFSDSLNRQAFVALRLATGEHDLEIELRGKGKLARLNLTRLNPSDPIYERFKRFESRRPHVGVHLGLRRDCGSTMNPVGSPQRVQGTNAIDFVFEGATNNFPTPDVQEDNDNYLAGLHEIGVRCEYTDGRDLPRLRIESVTFEGPFYESWPPKSHQSIFGPGEGISEPELRASAILATFASRAYRRPATDQEVAALLSVWRDSYNESGSFRLAIKHALMVSLTSPQFLFLIEDSASPAAEQIGPYELASKLSYFLWNGPPDQELQNLAGEGTLAENLREQVDRMIADDRFKRTLRQFATEWFSLKKLDVVETDRKRYPRLTRDAKRFLREQPSELLGHLIRNNLSVRHLIRSNVLVANEIVANYYGLGDRCESGFEFVPIQHDQAHLGGVLSHAGILAGLSDGREANPVKRGAWLARKILADPPDDPPPNVPELEEDTSHLPLRQRLEKHRNQKGCKSCHSGIDPWGVPLEDYDASGLFTPSPDSTSTLPDGTSVANSLRLRDYLAEEKLQRVAFSTMKHLTTFAIGRSLTYQEDQALQKQVTRLSSDGYRLRDMVHGIVRSDAFLMK